jgi:hypothetical protein
MLRARFPGGTCQFLEPKEAKMIFNRGEKATSKGGSLGRVGRFRQHRRPRARRGKAGTISPMRGTTDLEAELAAIGQRNNMRSLGLLER